jgi:hypothetical protein
MPRKTITVTLHWTRTPPTVDGWYWCRNCTSDNPVVLRLLDGAVVMAHLNIMATMLHAEWAGPIAPPGEES